MYYRIFKSFYDLHKVIVLYRYPNYDLGLRMWVNMRPYTTQLYNPIAVPYVIGITGQNNLIDQKRNLILIRPGMETAIKVIPRIVQTHPIHLYMNLANKLKLACPIHYRR